MGGTGCPPAKVNVRPILPSDLPALVDLFFDVFADDVATLGLERDRVARWAKWAGAWRGLPIWAARFSPWRPWAIVGELEGKLVSAAMVIGRRPPTIVTVATHPDFRRQGIARSVLSKILALARQRGVSRLALTVRTDNVPALALYRSLGFRPWLEDEVLVRPLPASGFSFDEKNSLSVRPLRREDLSALRTLAQIELPNEWFLLHGLLPEEHSSPPFLRLLGPGLGLGWMRIVIVVGGDVTGAVLCASFPGQALGEIDGIFLFDGGVLGVPKALAKAWDFFRQYEKEGMRLRLPAGRTMVRTALLRLGFVPKERRFQMVCEL